MAHTRQISDSASTGRAGPAGWCAEAGYDSAASRVQPGWGMPGAICWLVQTIACLEIRASMVSSNRSRRSTPPAETRAVGGCAGGWGFGHGCDDNEVSRRQDVSGVLRLSRSFLSQNSRSTDAMGRPKKPIQRRSNGVCAFSCTWMASV